MIKFSEILTSDKYVNGKFFGDGANRKPVVDRCEHKKSIFQLKIIPTNRPDLAYFPKYVPVIKESCVNCSKYISFARQTQDLVDLFNEKLKEIQI